MKGPILCTALVAAALFNGGCGESSTGHNAQMAEEELMFANLQHQEIENLQQRDIDFPEHDYFGGTHDPERVFHLMPIHSHKKQGLSAAEVRAAITAFRNVPELAVDGDKPTTAEVQRQLGRWSHCSAGAEPAIYFHYENDSESGFLSNFYRFPSDVTLPVSWLRKEAAATHARPAAVLSLPKGGDEWLSFFSSEQIFMYLKALVMGDDKSAVKIAAITKGSRNSMDAKEFGRRVVPYDEGVWKLARYNAMGAAVRVKFGVGSGAGLSELGERLLTTGHALLAEASPSDNIWGIGAGAEAGRAGHWTGLNLLGWVLMDVRAELREGMA